MAPVEVETESRTSGIQVGFTLVAIRLPSLRATAHSEAEAHPPCRRPRNVVPPFPRTPIGRLWGVDVEKPHLELRYYGAYSIRDLQRSAHMWIGASMNCLDQRMSRVGATLSCGVMTNKDL